MFYNCPICEKKFDHNIDYRLHVDLDECRPKPVVYITPTSVIYTFKEKATSKIEWKPRLDARGRPLYEPMDARHKKEIVQQVEKRLDKFIIS